jgi:acyl-coenzyme A synthetase/AMP-(fatty) acid ligase
VLLAHPAVAEAAVIGRPDPKWQEVPVAYVVCRAPVEADTLQQHVAGELARFKVPREFVFVDALPRNALGKVQHYRLRELADSKEAIQPSVIPGRREAANPESITTTGTMDSGQPALRTGFRNDKRII